MNYELTILMENVGHVPFKNPQAIGVHVDLNS